MLFVKKLRLIMIGTLALVCLFFACGTDAKAGSRGGYEINSYDCYYKVTEDNVYHVVETIDVTFNEYRHGIYRQIPEVNYIERLDGSKDTIVAQVDVRSCSDEYSDERVGNDREIKIGDPDEEIIGDHTYTIVYDVKWGNDRVDGEDEFYMNLIGDGWDVPVKNLTFTIELPKEFEDNGDNIGFYYGPYKESKIEGIRYSFDGKIIRGALIGYQIEPGAFFTTRIQLPDEYFKKNSEIPVAAVIALVLCCVFLTASLVIWILFGRDKDVIDIVEFYPPDGINCAEMSYAYYGQISNRDCVPMIITLAEKGYIQIVQTDEKGKTFSFKLLRRYEGTDESEKIFLDGLWSYGKVVTKKELENSFYKTLGEVVKNIKYDWSKKIFFKNSLWWRLITFPFAAIPYFVGLSSTIRWATGEPALAFLFPAIHCAAVSVLSIVLFSKKTKLPLRIILGIAFIFGIWLFSFFLRDIIDYMGMIYWVVYAACVVANIAQMLFFRIIDKRTDYGIDLLGRINGFKNYLETAERPHLVALVDQDPEYYYKILPYTYVLGITDAWVDQFESIAMEAPHWYHGYGYRPSTFDYHAFNSFMRSTMSSTQTAMTSTPGGSGSGGGFSGGGGGGGGGGSW